MKKILFAAMLLVSVTAWGATPDGAYWSHGARSCGVYLGDRAKNNLDETADEAWVAGYITAFDAFVPDTFNILGNTDLQSVMVWLDNYCKAHPLRNLADAMSDLTAVLYPRRYKTAKDAGH